MVLTVVWLNAPAIAKSANMLRARAANPLKAACSSCYAVACRAASVECGTKHLSNCRQQRAASSAAGSGCKAPMTTYEGSSCDSLQFLQNTPQQGVSRRDFIACELQQRMDLDAGFEVGEELGAGATATVYRAVSRRTGGAVALKAICKGMVPDEQLLRNEIEIHKATDHPNILRLLSTFEDEKFLYLVTELCEGGDLGNYMQVVGDEYSILQMEEEDALQVFQQIVASVRYIHKMGIVHRDLKPGNFLCAAWERTAGDESDTTPSRRRMLMKLTDFGVSASCGNKHLLTRRVGTDGYMAPEVLKCQPYNEKADMFSIGCILHTLITGKPPKRKDDGTYQADKLRLSYASDEMRSLISWLIQPLPEDRPSIEEVAAVPLLQRSQNRLKESTIRVTAILDQMHSFAAFPWLKKAALIAMVSRAESDKDFLPCIEKFRSFGSHLAMNYAISATDIYETALEEMQKEMEVLMDGIAEQKPKHRRRRHRGSNSCALRCFRPGTGTENFKLQLRSEIDELVRQIDCNLSNNIGYSEWLAATVDASWYSDPMRLSSVFKHFDVDGDGMISEGDLKKVIQTTLPGMKAEAILQESQLCAQPMSWLNFEHFSMLMCTGSLSTFTLRRIAGGVSEPLGFDAPHDSAGLSH